MTNIAFLGLGNMGGPMAANLVAAGHTVHGFDPVRALKEAAEAKGVKVFDSGAAAVTEADVVISSLPNGAVVKACYEVADQALQLHGGYGYLREYGLEKIVRDLRVHRILEGTNEIMRVVIGRAEAARGRASA